MLAPGPGSGLVGAHSDQDPGWLEPTRTMIRDGWSPPGSATLAHKFVFVVVCCEPVRHQIHFLHSNFYSGG